MHLPQFRTPVRTSASSWWAAHQVRQVRSTSAKAASSRPKVLTITIDADGLSAATTRPGPYASAVTPVWCSVRNQVVPETAGSAIAAGSPDGEPVDAEQLARAGGRRAGGEEDGAPVAPALPLDGEPQLRQERHPALGDVVVHRVPVRVDALRPARDPHDGAGVVLAQVEPVAVLERPGGGAALGLQHVGAVALARPVPVDERDLLVQARVVPPVPAADQRGVAQVLPHGRDRSGDGDLDRDVVAVLQHADGFGLGDVVHGASWWRGRGAGWPPATTR